MGVRSARVAAKAAKRRSAIIIRFVLARSSVRQVPVLCFLCANMVVRPQTTPPASRTVERLDKMLIVNCEPSGSRTVRSPRFLSPGARRSAWIEIKSARSMPKVGAGSLSAGSCENVSTLFVETKTAPPHRVFQIVPSTEWPGNGLAFCDWSPDGRRLLVRSQFFVFNSDVIADGFVLYRAEGRDVVQFSLANLLSRRIGRDCDVLAGRAGFSSTGELLVQAIPHEEGPSAASCVDKATWWRVDAGMAAAFSVDVPVQLRNYGEFERAVGATPIP